MNVLVFLYLYYKYNNSQTIIYNVTIIFKIEQLPINYECIMLLQIKVNIRTDGQLCFVIEYEITTQHQTPTPNLSDYFNKKSSYVSNDVLTL